MRISAIFNSNAKRMLNQNVQWLFILCICLSFRWGNALRKSNARNLLPLNPRAETVSPYEIKVTWSDPPKDSGIIGYSVKIHVYSQPDMFFQQSFESNEEKMYIQSDLEPNTSYVVTITSFDLLNDTASVRLLVLTPPKWPTLQQLNPKAEVVSPYEIKVTWSDPPKDSRVIGYSVKIHVYSQPDVFYQQNFGAKEEKVYTQSNLEPNTSYVVTITSFNFQNETSSVRLLVLTPPKVPPPPSDPKAEAISPFEIKVKWKAPDYDVGIVGYSVKINVVSRPNSFFLRSFKAKEQKAYTKSDLHPDTTYEVTITSKGFQRETSNVRLLVHTPPSFVPNRPTGFELGYVSKNMARYRWNYADAEDKVIGYILTARNNLTNETREAVIPPYRHMYILTQLEPGTVYELTLTAFNQNGTGPLSRSRLKTREYIPPKPSITFLQPVDSTAVYIKWRPEDKDENAPFVKGYHVFYQAMDDNETAHLIDTQTTESTELLITDLKPETQYYVVVSGYTSSSRGINSDKKIVTTPRKELCTDSLGMESGDILDSAITASSYFSELVAPAKGRIRADGGAWCPRHQITAENYEYLQINLDQPTKITQVEIQTNSANESIREYVQAFRLECQVVHNGEWYRYKMNEVEEILVGNSVTFLTDLIELSPPIICTEIRVVPYSAIPMELCLQVEIYGCRLQVELPRQPLDFQVVAVSDTEAEITWSPAPEEAFINNFVLTVSENGQNVIPEFDLASNSTGFPLKYLSPGATYIFKLAGQNEWGQGAQAVVRLKMPDKDEKPWLYFTNNFVIRRLEIDTRYEEVVLPTTTPRSVTLDVDHDLGLMFYSTSPNEDIYSLNINQKEDLDDGTVKEVQAADRTCNLGFNDSSVDPKIVVSELEGKFSADSLAVDWLYKNIYWTVKDANKISVASYNGKYNMILIDEGLDKPSAIALDPENGFMYWAEQGKVPKIRRSGMDGKLREIIVRERDGLGTPNGLTIDFAEKRIYWIDSRLRKIASANLDGSDIQTVIKGKDKVGFPASIAVFDDFLYFSDWRSKSIKSFNKKSKSNLTIVSKRRYAATVMVLYHAKRQSRVFAPEAKMLCERAHCDHLCLPTARYSENISMTVSCGCSDGYILEEMKYCVDENKIEILEEALTKAKNIDLPILFS